MEDLLRVTELKIPFVPQWLPFSRSSNTNAGSIYNNLSSTPLSDLRQYLSSFDSGLFERTDQKNTIWFINLNTVPEVVLVDDLPVTSCSSLATAMLEPGPAWFFDGGLFITKGGYITVTANVTGTPTLSEQDLDYRVYLESTGKNVVWLDPNNDSYPIGQYTIWYAVTGDHTVLVDGVPYSYSSSEELDYWDRYGNLFGVPKKLDNYTFRGQLQALTYLDIQQYQISTSIFPTEVSLWDLITSTGDSYDSSYWYKTNLPNFEIVIETPTLSYPYVYLTKVPEGKVELTINGTKSLYDYENNRLEISEVPVNEITARYFVKYMDEGDNPIFTLGDVPVTYRPLFKIRKITTSSPTKFLTEYKWGIPESVISGDTFN